MSIHSSDTSHVSYGLDFLVQLAMRQPISPQIQPFNGLPHFNQLPDSNSFDPFQQIMNETSLEDTDESSFPFSENRYLNPFENEKLLPFPSNSSFFPSYNQPLFHNQFNQPIHHEVQTNQPIHRELQNFFLPDSQSLNFHLNPSPNSSSPNINIIKLNLPSTHKFKEIVTVDEIINRKPKLDEINPHLKQKKITSVSSLAIQEPSFLDPVSQPAKQLLVNAINPLVEKKIFKCDVVTCNKTFAKLATLKSHLSTHTENRGFPCSDCPMAFRRSHDLKRHQRIHSGVRPYICSKCTKDFSRRDALQRHYSTNCNKAPYGIKMHYIESRNKCNLSNDIV